MKSAAQKSNVKVVVADDEAFMREVVVNTLTSGGYREVRTTARLESLQSVVDSVFPDLVILNGDMADGDSVEFIRRMRLGRVGRNPFVPIIVTAWKAERSFVRKILDSGADVLVTKPFAAGQLYARIEFLAAARPPFVVTSSYMGPDRRKILRGDERPRFDVPNTLRERFEGRPLDPEGLISRIEKVIPVMLRQRQLLQEQEIGGQFAVISKACREKRPLAEVSGVITTIVESAARYANEMASPHVKGDRDRAGALATMLVKIAESRMGFSGQDCEAAAQMLDALGIVVPASVGAKADSGVTGVSVHPAAAC